MTQNVWESGKSSVLAWKCFSSDVVPRFRNHQQLLLKSMAEHRPDQQTFQCTCSTDPPVWQWILISIKKMTTIPSTPTIAFLCAKSSPYGSLPLYETDVSAWAGVPDPITTTLRRHHTSWMYQITAIRRSPELSGSYSRYSGQTSSNECRGVVVCSSHLSA